VSEAHSVFDFMTS